MLAVILVMVAIARQMKSFFLCVFSYMFPLFANDDNFMEDLRKILFVTSPAILLFFLQSFYIEEGSVVSFKSAVSSWKGY